MLYEKYYSDGFEILAFPTNYETMMDHEKCPPYEIEEYAKKRMGTEFPIFQMTETPNGPDALDVFKFLRCNTEYFYDPAS